MEIHNPFFVICGFTGRDADEVAAHVRELGEMGVAPPPTAPLFMAMPTHLLMSAKPSVEVASASTSGEAEPVLIRRPDGEQFVAVGSDHTDRKLELASIPAAKAACPKLVSTEAWRMEDVGDRWDDLVLSSAVKGAPPHQEGTLSAIKRPSDLLAAMQRVVNVPDGRPLVMFLGTLAGSAAASSRSGSFVARLHDRATGRVLKCAYTFDDISTSHQRGASA